MLRVRFFCCCFYCCCSLFLFVLFGFFFFIVSGLLVLFGFAVVLVNLFHLRSAKYTEGLHTLKDLKSGEELRRPWDGWWSMRTNQQMWIHFLTIFQWFSQRNFLLQALGKKILNLCLPFSPEKTDWADQAFEHAPLQSVVTKVLKVSVTVLVNMEI